MVLPSLIYVKDIDGRYAFCSQHWHHLTRPGESIRGLTDFDIRKDFFGYSYNIHVSVDKFADGYRLPYYNEWMALARGGSVNYRYIWGDKKDSIVASQYAWFGIREPEDKYLKLKANDPMNRSFLKNSCGKWLQKSRPVGMLKPNSYGLYDMVGLVCENVMMYKKIHLLI